MLSLQTLRLKQDGAVGRGGHAEGLRRTLQLVRWSRLTSLASTFSLARITIWSVNVRQGTGVFLDLHPPMMEILRAVSYLDFWKPSIFFVFTFYCLLGSGCSGCSSSLGLLNIIKRQEHACFCHKLVQLLQLDHHQVQVAVHLPSSRQCHIFNPLVKSK